MSAIQKLISRLVVLILVSIVFGGCISEEKVVDVQVGKDITSLKIGDGETAGQSETIEVQALTDKGNNAAFTIETEGDCVSVSSTEDSITVFAGTELCEQKITVKSGSAEEKTITVNVYDPMVMDIGDGLLIRYVNTYSYQWDDRGTGGKNDVAFWHPVTDVENDWHPLGSLVVTIYDDVNAVGYFPMIVVKDSKNTGLLAAPTNYELVWNDSGSGKHNGNGSVWKALCPEGFVSFGVVTNGTWDKPPLEAIRCVKKEYTTSASIGQWIYNDENTGAAKYLSIWEIDYPAYTVSPDGRAGLLTGANIGCPDWKIELCDLKLANLLLVPLPVFSHSENMLPPKLTGYEPLKPSPRYFSSLRVPFTLIPSEYKDASPARVKINIEKSPFYYVQREETYMPVNIVNNTQNPNSAEYKYAITTGFEESESKKFSQEVGIEVTAKGECSFLGSGGGWEVKVSTKFGWERSVARTYRQATSRDFTFTVPAHTYAEIVQVTSQFRAIPMTDSILPQSEPFDIDSNILMYMQYPP